MAIVPSRWRMRAVSRLRQSKLRGLSRLLDAQGQRRTHCIRGHHRQHSRTDAFIHRLAQQLQPLSPASDDFSGCRKRKSAILRPGCWSSSSSSSDGVGSDAVGSVPLLFLMSTSLAPALQSAVAIARSPRDALTEPTADCASVDRSVVTANQLALCVGVWLTHRLTGRTLT